jgi:hypothetical protein
MIAAESGSRYRISEGDVQRLQELINELRSGIQYATTIPSQHRARLLSRLEKLQIELHKQMSNLDSFWGFIIDIGSAARRFGEDMKPIVDRCCEVLEIVWAAQARADELPTGTALPRDLISHSTAADAQRPHARDRREKP